LFEGRIIRYGNQEEGSQEGRQESCKEGDQKSNQEEVVKAAEAAFKNSRGLAEKISRPFSFVPSMFESVN